MRAPFQFNNTLKQHPSVSRWFEAHQGPLGDIARQWFDALHHCGDDVEEILHDGQPTACVRGAAFAYVDVFTAHVNIGFFQGAALPDPESLLLGNGKFMRHVKLSPDQAVNAKALLTLINAAYLDVNERLASM